MTNQIVGFKLIKVGRHFVSGTLSALAFGLALSATSAQATEYFKYESDATYEDLGATVVEYSNSGATSLERDSVDLADDVVFEPIGVVNTYVGVDGGRDLNSQDYDGSTSNLYFDWDRVFNDTCNSSDSCDRLYYQAGNTLATGTYTVTFLAGDNANDIYKNLGNNIKVDNISGNGRYIGTLQDYEYRYLDNESFDYTANLVFQGVNTVSGYTDIDGGSIQINGSVNFAGTVEAGNVNVNTTSGVYFNSNVVLNSAQGFENAIVFERAGEVSFNADLDGSVDFAGNDGIVMLNDSQVTGSIDTASSGTGTLIFGGSANIDGSVGATAALKKIQLDSNQVNIIDGATQANTVEINAAGVLGFGGGLDTTLADATTLGVVDFNNYNATVQIGNDADLVGNVVTDANNNGNLVLVAGTQSITGQLGASGKSIARLVIGGEESFSSNPDPVLQGLAAGDLVTINDHVSNTTINGDVYATNTYLYNDGNNASSSLTMASGYNLNSTVQTGDTGMGVLTLAGGLQTVTGNVGTDSNPLDQVDSGANGATSNFGTSSAVTDVFADAVTNTGSGTTNFSKDVTATNTLNVNAGTTNVANDTAAATINITSGKGNFTNIVSATTTNIGTGEGNFNTNGTGTTTSNIAFTGAGTANLHTGLTGAVAFAGNDATVNVWNLQTVVGDVTTTTNNTGILNFKGDGLHTGDIGAESMGIASLNVNTASEQNSTEGVLVVGSIFADSITLNGGALTVEVDENLTDTGSGDFITTVASVNSAGELRLLGGTQVVDGTVGTDEARLRFVNTSFSQSGTTTFTDTVYIDRLENGGYSSNQAIDGTVTLDGMAYINTLNVNTDGGVVNLNGINASDNAPSGMIGQLALNNTIGTVNIGDDVDLTVINPLLTQDEGVFFSYAGNASLNFVGSSTVNGQVGGGEDSANSTFKTIHAGANDETVTFNDDVYVIEGTLEQPATFHVSGTGTVNFEGDLIGDLVFDEDGVVNMSAGKSIKLSSDAEVLAATTGTDGEGTINFLGATTLASDLGESAKKLKAVNFNTDSNDVVQTIDKNIFANAVTIGNSEGDTGVSLQNITGEFDYAGASQISVFSGGTTANVTENVTLGGNLTLANATTALNVGTSHITLAGNMVTNGAAMSFTVNTNDISQGDDADSTSTGSGRINLASSKSLTLSRDEKIHINYVGSLRDAGTYELIDVDGGTGTEISDSNFNINETSTQLSDNSFSIDSRIYQRYSNGSLVVQAVRSGADYAADELYAYKSNTLGHFSNNAASVLAGIAADGTQSGDMVQVIQKIELDAYGYGNTAEKLATQVKRLAPVANDAMTQSALSVSGMAVSAVDSRMSSVRTRASGMNSGDVFADRSAWFKFLGASGQQDSTGDYDGYKYASTGIMVGADLQVSSQLLVGGALSHTRTDIDQTDFRTGDSTDLEATHLTAYGAYALDEKIYVEGSLSYGWLGYEGHRQTAIDRVAQSDFSGDQLGLNLTAGYRIPLSGKQLVTPMVKLDYSRVKNEVYSETGADALNLVDVTEPSLERTRLGLGVKYQNEWVHKNTTYLPEVSLSYSSALGSQDDKSVSASYQGGGESFLTPVSLADEDALNLSLGMTMFDQERSSLNLRYDLESRDGFVGQGAELTFRVRF
jgi:outer membrane autotransporter protein